MVVPKKKIWGGEGWKKKKYGGNSGHYVVASQTPDSNHLQHRRSCQNKNDSMLMSEVTFHKMFDVLRVSGICMEGIWTEKVKMKTMKPHT